MSPVFLFGAGASYGSDTASTPPLGADLFNALVRFNSDGWGALPSSLQSSFNADFEQAMRSLPPHTIAPLQRAMAAFFFQFAPTHTNLYFNIAKRVKEKSWKGAFCTLNYERLLELSLLAAGVQPYVGDQPSTPHAVELCLPHGCCHLFCDSAFGDARAVSFDAFNVCTDGPVSVIADAQNHRRRISSDAFPPVMSYFEPEKRTTAGASFINGQRTRWEKLALTSSKIIIVGVRVREHDNHIWGPIAASNSPVVYCGGPGDIEEFRNWSLARRAESPSLVFDSYFRGAFERLCEEASL